MLELVVFNLILILVITVALILCKRWIRTERGADILLLLAAVLTILCHYSSLPYHHFLDGSAMTYLRHNPNLILPIYPCNVVMWSCIVYGLMRKKTSRAAEFLATYIFWFGIFSTLIGMFANVDFIREPNLGNYDITKGILAHATMLFNVLPLPVFGRIKINFGRNMLQMLIAVLGMYGIGLYCNLVFEVLVSAEMAASVNSMFILQSPFAGLPFLRYPIIAAVALVLYAILFAICELVAHKKGERWFDRVGKGK